MDIKAADTDTVSSEQNAMESQKDAQSSSEPDAQNDITVEDAPSAHKKATQSENNSATKSFSELNALDQFIAFFFMTAVTNMNAEEVMQNDVLLSILGIETPDEFNQFKQQSQNGAWMKNHDFKDFDFKEAGQFTSQAIIAETGNADFDEAVYVVLEAEGGLSNHSSDRSGLTKFGISSRANPGIDVANLTVEDAVGIYKDKYWDTIPGIDQMDRSIAISLFDASVNHGAGFARKMAGELADKGLTDNPDQAVDYMMQRRAHYYSTIIENDPSQAVFREGWNNRLENLNNYLEETSAVTVAANAAEGAKPLQTNRQANRQANEDATEENHPISERNISQEFAAAQAHQNGPAAPDRMTENTPDQQHDETITAENKYGAQPEEPTTWNKFTNIIGLG